MSFDFHWDYRNLPKNCIMSGHFIMSYNLVISKHGFFSEIFGFKSWHFIFTEDNEYFSIQVLTQQQHAWTAQFRKDWNIPESGSFWKIWLFRQKIGVITFFCRNNFICFFINFLVYLFWNGFWKGALEKKCQTVGPKLFCNTVVVDI